MKKSILNFVVLFVFGVAPVFSQTSDKDKELRDSLEKSRQDEMTRQQDERDDQMRREAYTLPYMFGPEKRLLPKGDGAWVLFLFTSGGFSGRGKPTVVVTSDAAFSCGENLPSRFNLLEGAKFEPLSNIITSLNFNRQDLAINLSQGKTFVCNDCYKTDLVLIRRESNGDVKTYQNSLDKMKFQAYLDNFNSIQQYTNAVDLCQR